MGRKRTVVPSGVRYGVLSPYEFESIAHEAMGVKGWATALARGTGWSPSTITRYRQGKLPVPQHVATLLEALMMLRRAGLPLPECFNPKPRAPGPHER